MKKVDIWAYIWLLVILLLFSREVYGKIDQQLAERRYHENLQVISHTPFIEQTVHFLDYSGIPITIERREGELLELIQIERKKEDVKEKEEIRVPENFPQENNILRVLHYVDDIEVIIPENRTTLYRDLKKGVVWNPSTRNFTEKGITFIEGHSGSGHNFSYNYFDRLALFYNNLGLETRLQIENKGTGQILQYRLERKEIINPGEKALQEQDGYYIVLMTCYPRNTTQKRALFYFRLEKVW